MTKLLIKSKAEMINLAKKIADNCQKGDIFALTGTLGAGKTFFVQNFINSLLREEQNILSPTFNLVYSYDSKKGKIFHFDLYRLKSAEELENIGFFEALKEGICLIEWPEIAQNFLPKNLTKISINLNSNDGEEVREINITKILHHDRQ